MATLKINDTFETSLFQFAMQPPFRKFYQHNLQNGNTALDTIAFKDKFDITFPYLSQDEYNRMTQFLESLTSPTLKIEYKTAEITRVWDGLTAYSAVSAVFSTTPVYLSPNGISVNQATTNEFTNPSGEDGSTTGVSGEDGNIAVTNDGTVAKFGLKSFKVVNSNAPTWAPVSADSACGYAQSYFTPGSGGALAVSIGARNLALYTGYTAGNALNAVWTYHNVTNYSDTFPINAYATDYDNYMEQRVLVTGGIDMLFQAMIANVNGIDYKLQICNDSGVVVAEKTYHYVQNQQYTPCYVRATSTTAYMRCRIVFLQTGSWNTLNISEIMVLDTLQYGMLYYCPVFIPTDAAMVDRHSLAGFGYDSPRSVWAMGNSLQRVKQSVFCKFKTADWPYNDGGVNYKRKTLFTSVLSNANQPDTDVHFITDNLGKHYLRIFIQGSQVLQWEFQDTTLATNAWHWIALVMGDAEENNFRVYLDDLVTPIFTTTLTSKPILGNLTYSGATGKFLIGNRAYYDGSWHNATFNSVYHHFEGYIADFTICNWEIDDNYSYRSLPTMNMLSVADIDLGNNVFKNEDIAFLVRGASSSAYIARAVYFNLAEDIGASCSAHVYFGDVGHKKLSLIGRAKSYTFYYDVYNVIPFLYQNMAGYPAQTWSRVFLEGQFLNNNATHPGAFAILVPIGETMWVDGVQIENNYNGNYSATDYCDGSQPNCAWTGTPNASTSTRAAQTLYVNVPASLAGTTGKDFSLLLRFSDQGAGYFYTNGYAFALRDPGSLSSVYLTYTKGGSNSWTWTVYATDYLGNALNGGGNASLYAVFDRNTVFSVALVKTSDALKIYADGKLILTIDMTNKIFKVPSMVYFGSDGANLLNQRTYEVALLETALGAWDVAALNTGMRQLANYTGLLNYYNFAGSLDSVIGSNQAVNADVKRVRNRVFWTNMNERAHLQNLANKYQIKLQFQEV